MKVRETHAWFFNFLLDFVLRFESKLLCNKSHQRQLVDGFEVQPTTGSHKQFIAPARRIQFCSEAIVVLRR